MMNIQFLGAVQTVTGSMHLLTVNGMRILLDCGLYQGRRMESFERNRHLPFDPKEIDVLVLSHAHIDHSGNVPSLVKAGFDGYIFSTPATRDLCAVMLRDSAYIQQSDAEYVNKKRRKEGQPPVESLYSRSDVDLSLEHFVSIGYGRPFPIGPGVQLTFYDAGHILGSAFVCLDIQENGRQRRVLFTGDLGRPNMPLLLDPVIPHHVDVLITESTYGDRLHGTQEDRMTQLGNIVNQTYDRGGKVIIPSFALGRTQGLVYSLHQLLDRNQIPVVPVFVDSPLAVNATEVFLLHENLYDEETKQFLIKTQSMNPFSFGNLRYIREVEQSKALNELREPAIIISASGMCEAGRILHHLKNNIENRKNAIVIVGWQAPHTLGRRLVEKQPQVRIFGEPYHLRADVQVISGYSAHADRDELLDWFRQVREQSPELEHVFVVHGEKEASNALAKAFIDLGTPGVRVPEPAQTVTI